MPDQENNSLVWRWIFGILFAFPFCVFFVCLLLPGAGSGTPARRSTCKNNLRQIGIALHNYMDQYGGLPPTYIADENGKPLHSWRVLLLPFLEQSNLYELLDLSKPWDAPENLTYTSMELPVFQCPSIDDQQALGNRTNYVAIIGPNTAWRGTQPVRKQELGDDPSNLVLLAEIADARIPWAKPVDLHIDTMVEGINTSKTNGVSSQHVNGAQVLLADRHVRFLAQSEILHMRARANIDPSVEIILEDLIVGWIKDQKETRPGARIPRPTIEDLNGIPTVQFVTHSGDSELRQWYQVQDGHPVLIQESSTQRR